MQTVGMFMRFLAFLTMIAWGCGNATDLFAQTILSGAALEKGCGSYADRAVQNATEWEQFQCQKKLNVSPQLFDTDRTYHLKRCFGSAGTAIASDLQSMENDLKMCRGLASNPSARPPANQPHRDYPSGKTENQAGDMWDIVVINSEDLARSLHAYRIHALGGPFTARNMQSGGPELSGTLNGSVFKALMTDRTGYEATFIGRLSGTKRIEGTGFDNRGRSFSFTMIRR